MKTVAPFSPTVIVEAHPGAYIMPGQSDTFIAVVSNAGLNPEYQWAVNNTTIAGATNSVYVTNTLSHLDSVSCMVTTTGICNGNQTFNWIIVSVNNVGFDDVTNNSSSIMLLPNPNRGEFVLKGKTGNATDGLMQLQVVDVLGKVVFGKEITVANGIINEHIVLDHAIANGMYLLHLTLGGESKVLHFVVSY